MSVRFTSLTYGTPFPDRAIARIDRGTTNRRGTVWSRIVRRTHGARQGPEEKSDYDAFAFLNYNSVDLLLSTVPLYYPHPLSILILFRANLLSLYMVQFRISTDPPTDRPRKEPIHSSI